MHFNSLECKKIDVPALSQVRQGASFFLFLGIEIFPIGLDVVDTRPDGHDGGKEERQPRQWNDIGAPPKILTRNGLGDQHRNTLNNRLKEDRRDRDDLRDRLDLTEHIGSDDDALSCRDDKAHRGHGQLAEYDNDEREDHHETKLREFIENHEHRADDHELIGNRIEELTEIGNQVVAARDLTVKHIGDSRANKEHRAHHAGHVKGQNALGQHADQHQHGNETETENRQSVRYVKLHTILQNVIWASRRDRSGRSP